MECPSFDLYTKFIDFQNTNLNEYPTKTNFLCMPFIKEILVQLLIIHIVLSKAMSKYLKLSNLLLIFIL